MGGSVAGISPSQNTPDVFAQKSIEAQFAARHSEDGFRDFAEGIVQHVDEVFFWRDPDSLTPYFVSHAYERIWGQSCQSAYAEPSSWIESIHPDDRERVIQEFERAATGSPDTGGVSHHPAGRRSALDLDANVSGRVRVGKTRRD